ncbi:metal ABC transporter permease [Kallotenue papyrolyticum]|uniref:metal ABC transporter permease n=1 Tax=Kallotenue papyrolyticum TaxID=1325125 RepID=UPI00047859D4|nr:metal ABC transporter permease [Kallotenue papyrolyticum]
MHLFTSLLEPLSLRLMQRGLAAALIVALVCAVIGTFVVLRGLAFMGDALGHAVFPGVVVAHLLGAHLLLGGLLAGLLLALGVGVVTSQRQLRESTAIGILYTLAFALGAVLLSRSANAGRLLSDVLLGNVLAVRPGDLLSIALVGGGALLVVALGYKELVLTAFDPDLAAALGRRVTLWNLLLLALLALAIVVALQTVGAILVVALLVVPPATGRLLARSIPAIMGWAALCGSLSAIAGVYLSYYVNIASGSAITLSACLLFATALVARGARRRLLQRASH